VLYSVHSSLAIGYLAPGSEGLRSMVFVSMELFEVEAFPVLCMWYCVSSFQVSHSVSPTRHSPGLTTPPPLPEHC
jgi:hypothetical protein